MIELLTESWPMILAAISGAFVWISQLRVKNAKQEAQTAKNNAKAEKKARLAIIAQNKATLEGVNLKDEIIAKAHEEGSDGDLTRSDY